MVRSLYLGTLQDKGGPLDAKDGTGYPLSGVTLKANGANFVRKWPTITIEIEVSKFP